MDNQLNLQFHSLSKNLKRGDISVPDFGELVPASVMLHDLHGFQPTGCSYMNNWGIERLGTSLAEINAMGESYYDRFFPKEEYRGMLQGMSSYLSRGDFDQQYNFFQRVKLDGKTDYAWFYTVCKLVKLDSGSESVNKVVVMSSPVAGMNDVIARVTKALNQDSYIRQHYAEFSELTLREKEVLALLAHGRSSAEISDILFISHHTVSTHRRNIFRKINCRTFAELVRFALAFDLV